MCCKITKEKHKTFTARNPTGSPTLSIVTVPCLMLRLRLGLLRLMRLFSPGEFCESCLSVLVIVAFVQLCFLRGPFFGLLFYVGIRCHLNASSLEPFNLTLERFHFLPRFLLRSLQLADPALEQVVDHFELADTRAQGIVVRR